jgi:hypothetical protein
LAGLKLVEQLGDVIVFMRREAEHAWFIIGSWLPGAEYRHTGKLIIQLHCPVHNGGFTDSSGRDYHDENFVTDLPADFVIRPVVVLVQTCLVESRLGIV